MNNIYIYIYIFPQRKDVILMNLGQGAPSFRKCFSQKCVVPGTVFWGGPPIVRYPDITRYPDIRRSKSLDHDWGTALMNNLG